MKQATALVESRRFQPPASVLATVQATQHRVAPFTAPHFSCLPKKSKQKKAPRHPGLRFAKTSLVSALLRGSPRRVILDPSRLIWHPCQMPLCTAPALGLLTGMVRLLKASIFNASSGWAGAACWIIRRVDNRVALSTLVPSGGKAAGGVFRPTQAIRWVLWFPSAACPWSTEGRLHGCRIVARMQSGDFWS